MSRSDVPDSSSASPRPSGGRNEEGPNADGSSKDGPLPAIELRDITKRFGSVLANNRISLRVAPGTIHGIVGENGAGKSTLMSILYGYYRADSGDILLSGRATRIRNTAEAIAAGIGMVHQHFMLVDTFTVLENVVLGAEGGAMLAGARANGRAALLELASNYGLSVDPDALVGDLPVGIRQRVEILKALFRGARILVLDEPTGVLTPQEADALFDVLRALRAQGVTILMITHKLREIMAITDEVSVMRHGEVVAARRTARTNEVELAELMVGRKVVMRVEKQTMAPGEAILSVRDLQVCDPDGFARVRGVSFDVRAGEIVGIAGVAGNGQSELLEALAGIRPVSAGSIQLRGRLSGRSIDSSHPMNPREMRSAHVAHVPEDRLRLGMIADFEASESFILGYHDDPKYLAGPFADRSAIRADCLARMKDFDVRPVAPALTSSSFSGGNQQKLVLARELSRAPDLLLIGQPTRGVDIGAIEFLHRRLVDMRNAGKAILLVSVELDEVMALSDRIIVMFDGRIAGEVPGEEADELSLGLLMSDAAGSEMPAVGGASASGASVEGWLK